MPFAGGTFSRLFSWATDALNGIDISSSRMDAETNGIATGLSTCILKDGSQTITANIPWNNKKITVLGTGTAATDAANVGQLVGLVSYLGTAAGTNTLTASATPAISAYVEGQIFTFKASNPNTGATTLNINSLGAINIFKKAATGPVAMTGGEIATGDEVRVIYDGTQFQIVNPKNPLTTETTIASATTTDLGTLASNIASISGAVTITSLGSSASVANPLYFIRFTGALILTYNASSLILPTAANITTVAGDTMVAKYEGSGNWRIINYSRADGTALAVAVASDLILQRLSTSSNSILTGTTQIPFDDTVPQNTEGDQYLSLAITPKNAANILVIEFLLNISNSAAANFTLIGSVCQDAIANAIFAECTTVTSSTGIYQIHGHFEVAAGTTSATTFKVRAGASTAGTTSINGQSGARRFGGVLLSYLTITEYST